MARRPSAILGLSMACLTLVACDQYGGREPVIPVAREPGDLASGPASGYLIDRSDWVLGVREEILELNVSSPSVGRPVQFDGREMFVESGSKVLIWQCDGQWVYTEVFVDSQRFQTPSLAPSCVA